MPEPHAVPPARADRARRANPGRRAVLLGGLGLAAATVTAGTLVADDVLPGRVRLSTLLGLNGPDGTVPEVEPGPVDSGSFLSAARMGARTGWMIARPPGGSSRPPELPVCVVLPGRGATERSLLDLGLDRFLADAVRRGVPPFALAAVGGGGDSYWHTRRTGGDPGRMVVEEFLPLLAARGLAAGPEHRIGLLGWSMGGYGALLLGERLGPARVAAIGVLGPALFRRFADAAPGAFDDAADFATHDVYAPRDRLQGITLRIDCGRSDPFRRDVESFVDGLHPAPEGGFPAGGHTDGFWRRMFPAHLALIGRALT